MKDRQFGARFFLVTLLFELLPITTNAALYSVSIQGSVSEITEVVTLADGTRGFSNPQSTVRFPGAVFSIGDLISSVWTIDAEDMVGGVSDDGYQYSYIQALHDGYTTIGSEFFDFNRDGGTSTVDGRYGSDLVSVWGYRRDIDQTFLKAQATFIDNIGNAISGLEIAVPGDMIWNYLYQVRLSFVFPNEDQIWLEANAGTVDVSYLAPVPLPAAAWMLLAVTLSMVSLGRIRKSSN